MKCVFCDKRAVQEHHVIPQQELKSRVRTLLDKERVRFPGGELPPIRKVLADPRNKVGVCWDCHQKVENKRIYLSPSQLPDGIDEFAAELGLTWWLDKHVYSTERRTA